MAEGVSGLGICLQARKRPVVRDLHCHTSADWPSPMMLTNTTWEGGEQAGGRRDGKRRMNPLALVCTLLAGVLCLQMRWKHAMLPHF